jgi:hypothetical protein
MKISGDFTRYRCDVEILSVVHNQISLKNHKQRCQYAPMAGCNGSKLKMPHEQRIFDCFGDAGANKQPMGKDNGGSTATCHKKYAQNQRL